MKENQQNPNHFITEYLKKVNDRFKDGNTTEHTFRGFLADLIEQLVDVKATNEPKRQGSVAPDYLISQKNNPVPIGYIEAKDIKAGILDDLEAGKINDDQLDRYLFKGGFDNLITTDYLEFRLFRETKKVKSVVIAKVSGKKIQPITENFDEFKSIIIEFCSYRGLTIKSSEYLANIMAEKAKLLQQEIISIFPEDKDNNGKTKDGNSNHPAIYDKIADYGNGMESDRYRQEQLDASNSLQKQLDIFKKILIHDMDKYVFADIYAQTIVYGLFAARINDPSLETFSRKEAQDLVPQNNPFLCQFFAHISGNKLAHRLVWIIDSLADIYRACDIHEMLKDFMCKSGGKDPILHFYENFLDKYNPELRKTRGVYYTPEPVVKFIVRSVDEILKTEFSLPQGLADTSKVEIEVENEKHEKTINSFHKVQILDPAVGTGTFLCEVINEIYAKFATQKGMWNSYVEQHLIPRLHGFEYLMAPYAICHMKMGMLLAETGYKSEDNQRLGIYLTNSLHRDDPNMEELPFGEWLSNEANEANRIKRDTPVMVVMGNPPYAVSSSNKGEWIQNLIADYKKNLNEKKINLDDDYIKFIRYAEHFIEKNGQGIVAMITNNSFIYGITHRQMRKHLLETFDKIYILDLHGNSKKKEVPPDGCKDENVFDIMQGVSINILIKTGKKKENELGEVFHFDFWGKKEGKYEALSNGLLKLIDCKELDCKEPYFFFVPKNFDEVSAYETGFKVDDLFLKFGSGVQTDRDPLFIDNIEGELKRRINILLSGSYDSEFVEKYNIRDSSSYNLLSRIESSTYTDEKIIKINYRPFDYRFIYYDEKLISRPGYETNKNLLPENKGLIIKRGFEELNAAPCFIVNTISDRRGWSRPGMQGAESIAPLYIYPDKDELNLNEGKATARTPNLDMEIVAKFADTIGMEFKSTTDIAGCEPVTEKNVYFTPEDFLDYIYSVLNSPNYREKYKEFLKIDFPRIPLPESAEEFWTFVKKGCELRKLHLLESPELDVPITTFTVPGDNRVEKVEYVDGNIFINKEQYFGDVPQVSWDFFIGGYQPAQHWLKERKKKRMILSCDDIAHYQKIIIALKRTAEIMADIDKIRKF